jgi:hypothetical protein
LRGEGRFSNEEVVNDGGKSDGGFSWEERRSEDVGVGLIGRLVIIEETVGNTLEGLVLRHTILNKTKLTIL